MSDKIDKIAEKLDNQEDRQGTRKILDAINRQYLYYVITLKKIHFMNLKYHNRKMTFGK